MPVYKRKEDNKWYARVNYINEYGEYKQKKSKYFDSKREAQDAEISLRLELKNGKIRTADNKITFQQAYEEFVKYQKNRVKDSTIITYQPMWNHFTLSDIQIEKLTVPMYNKFKDSLLEKGLSTHRANNVHKLIKQVSDYASSMYDIKSNVVAKCGGFKDKNKIRKEKLNFYTYKEFQQFIAQADELKYKALFTFLYYEGTRIGEANALTWKDIDFKGNQIYINKTVSTKVKGMPYVVTSSKETASDRVIPMVGEVKDLLGEYKENMKKYKQFSEDWFVFGGTFPMPESHLHDVKNRYADKAGLKHIRIHDFRHSAASFYINELNAQPIEIQALLGHANLQTTLTTYAHMYPNRLSGLSDRLKKYRERI